MKSDVESDEKISLERCLTPSLASPLHCLTLSATPSPPPSNAILLNYHNNPLIGGPGVLLSPTLTNDDSNPPGLTPCDNGLDTTDDSGIDDDTIVAENMSPLKRTHEQQPLKDVKEIYATILKNAQYQNNNKDSLHNDGKLKMNGNTAFINGTPINLYDDEEDGATLSKRKRSISYMDSSNPLMTTPFLMDLCNDDYNMNTKEFLEEADIDNVLSVWPTELV